MLLYKFIIYFRALVYILAQTLYFFHPSNFLRFSTISLKNQFEIATPINFIDVCRVIAKRHDHVSHVVSLSLL